MEIKQLTPEWDFRIKQLKLQATRVMGQNAKDFLDPSQVLADMRNLRLYLNPAEPNYNCWGAVDGDTLLAVVHECINPVEHLWRLQWIGTNTKVDTGIPFNGMFKVLDRVMAKNIEAGIYTWIGAIPKRYQKVYDKLWRAECPAYQGFKVIKVEEVKAGSVPDSSETFQTMFSHTVPDIDMLVRSHRYENAPAHL